MNDPVPLVSVVMPVYNGETYLREAVESILGQTYRNFELIAIDDGSTDHSAAILAEYHQLDERIVILTHSKNQGIVSALNKGLKISNGKYIARMDADDISLKERLERQVGFLEAHPQVGILGSAAIFMEAEGKEIARMGKENDDLSIRWTSLLANIFFHPTVMMRREILVENQLGYRTNLESVEDYDLWVRLLEHTQGANLEEPLVHYRVHSESITSQSKQDQMEKHIQISSAAIQRLSPEIHIMPDELNGMVAAFTGELNPSRDRERPALALKYFKLWQVFVDAYRGNPGLKALRHETVVLAGKIGLFPPLQPGWIELMRRLFAEDPFWMFFFFTRFINMLALKIRGIRLGKLRRTRSQE